MTEAEAIKILDPETTIQALAEIEYYAGFNGQKAKMKAVDEACVVAVKALEEVQEYRNLEEQGLLIRVPSKNVWESSGDAVYYIYDDEIVECVNCGISVDCEGNIWIALACDEDIFPYRTPIPEIDTSPEDWCKNSTDVKIEEWGKSVFLTREEAEAALKEMEK